MAELAEHVVKQLEFSEAIGERSHRRKTLAAARKSANGTMLAAVAALLSVLATVGIFVGGPYLELQKQESLVVCSVERDTVSDRAKEDPTHTQRELEAHPDGSSLVNKAAFNACGPFREAAIEGILEAGGGSSGSIEPAPDPSP